MRKVVGTVSKERLSLPIRQRYPYVYALAAASDLVVDVLNNAIEEILGFDFDHSRSIHGDVPAKGMQRAHRILQRCSHSSDTQAF